MKLSDKYTLERGRVYLTGIQALVRLPVDQMRRDHATGLNTGTFISGYEGSPLGGYDMALTRSGRLLAEHNIHFVPGVNEDLAATSVMGSQIIHVMDRAKVDGVVGIWYGKGPGVDRSGDIFRHANLAGTGNNCGALVLCGDDHISKSSTIPHQSDFSLLNHGIPFLFPGNTQEVLDYGLYAIALSRFTGAWAGLKMLTDICDGGGTVEVDPTRPDIRIPDGYEKRIDARIVAPITLMLEHEVNVRRIEAALRFARFNALNSCRGDGRLGILTAGKSYYDLIQALHDLQVDVDRVRVGKVAMPFPLDPEFVRAFADGLDTVIVVEEKRSFLEWQLKDALYGADRRPVVHGKDLFPPTGELDPDFIADALAPFFGKRRDKHEDLAQVRRPVLQRPAAFCSGCPHNRSTLLLDGQVAGGGIGCHTMAMRLADSNRGFVFMTQMGGEGAPWIGMAPFVDRPHIFQNLGDGTLFHSGYLAIEACVAANVNITYKILFNGHVAMTGGQKPSGALTIPQLTKKLQAEGVRKTVVLAEDVDRFANVLGEFATNVDLRSRDDLPKTLAEMEKIPGVTVIIYDQQCAAEKRRMRSRGLLKEPTKRLFINEEVCEGCGDCVKQANCMSLMPVMTELGQKMRIHQSSCNKDYTCGLGDCPSFVTVNIKPGTGLKKRRLPDLPEGPSIALPQLTKLPHDGYRIIGPGIGGTGVVTINALLATAAWIEGLHVATLDQTGTAQKGGAVVSHLILSEQPIDVPAKINTANADLILGFDILGVTARENLKTARAGHTVAVINTDLVPTIDVIRNRLPIMGAGNMLEPLNQATDPSRNIFIDANRLAESLFGSHMAANIFLTGVAWQAGLIPLSLESIEAAIELNGVEKTRNLKAFAYGRKHFVEPIAIEQAGRPVPLAFDRKRELVEYQNETYARAYADFIAKIPNAELREVVARNLYKLMAYKDEYEVARLLTKHAFKQRIEETFEAPESISFNLHPPLLRRFGLHRKMRAGQWFRYPLLALKHLKVLRGTPFDLFGYAAHRRKERELITWYRSLIETVLERVTPDNLDVALEIAAIPDQIRGYEKIKEGNIEKAKKEATSKIELLQRSRVTAAS